MINKTPITTSISPNIEKDDLILVKKLIFQPRLGKKNDFIKELEEKIKTKFGFKHVFLTNSARAAFYLLLKALNFKASSQIAIQGFTCSAAINPILWNGLMPLYIDIDDSWNLDPGDLKKKINPKTKAVVVQHSFGVPANIEAIKKVCREKELFLVEDLALSLGAKYQNKYCGTFSDAAYLSFGRDKVISSVFGGALITNDQKLAEKILPHYQNLRTPSIFWTYQQLFHPLIFSLIMPFYHLKMIRLFLFVLQRFNLVSLPVTANFISAKLPNQLAVLALNQLNKLERFNANRKKIAKIYQKELNFPTQKTTKNTQPVYLRYNFVNKNAQRIIKNLRKEKIYLGDWYSQPIDPPKTDLNLFHYKRGMCPKAERLAGSILNLPTHINITENQARFIVKKLNDFEF